MGPNSAADAALFLEMVCGTVALVRCLRFVVSMGPQVLLLLLRRFFLDSGVLKTAGLTWCLRFVAIGSVP